MYAKDQTEKQILRKKNNKLSREFLLLSKTKIPACKYNRNKNTDRIEKKFI
jgi:hypothetical protein